MMRPPENELQLWQEYVRCIFVQESTGKAWPRLNIEIDYEVHGNRENDLATLDAQLSPVHTCTSKK
jgi:hypothetical protein